MLQRPFYRFQASERPANISSDNQRSSEMLSSAKTLVVSYIGMQTQEVAVKSVLKIVLKSDSELLNEVVVTGYGSAKKIGSVVGSVAKVNNDKLSKPVTSNFTDALSGQVAGLSVLQSSGDPSKSATIRLRGITSINASTTPLFILDGAPISSSLFNTLNPADIEDITVLKDAASTAIYGSRAANGVIVITSKRGKYDQKAKVTLRAQYGVSQMVQDQIDMMNSEQYIAFRDKIGVPVSDEVKDLVSKYGISTNWRNVVFDDNAPTYTLDASVQGGGSNVSYYLSVNHHDQQGIMEQSGMRRETIRFNMNAKVNKWMKVGLQSNLGFTKYELNSESESSSIYVQNPAAFARFALPYDSPYDYTFDESGNIVYGEKTSKLHYTGYSTTWFVNKYRSTYRRNVTGNLNMFEEFTPIKGLTLRAQQAMDGYDYTLTHRVYPYDAQTNAFGDKISARTGTSQRSFSRYYSFTYTNTAEYKFNIDRHHVNALLGQESIISKSDSFGAYSTGLTDNRQMKLTQGTTVAISNLSESRGEEVFNSYFFNAGYNYDEKYYLDFSLRRDGSSLFAPDHRWSTFFSIGGRWNIMKEDFMSSLRQSNWLNDLSIRASYGTVGNSGIDNYGYFGLIGSGTKTYNGNATLGISQASNYDLTWETVKSTNIGLTFRLFDRVNVDAEFYNKKTENMLMEIPYSYTTGFDSGWGNVGAMVNRGVDLEVIVDLLKNKKFNWSVKANFNYNHNEITELFDGRDEFALPNYGLMYKVGHDCGELYQVRYAGVDPRDGKQMWYDKNGNLTKTYNEEEDAVLIGKSTHAPYTGGFGTNFAWNGFSLSADFTWAEGKYMINNDNYFLENSNQGTSINQTTRMLNIWSQPGDITDIPKYGEEIQFDSHLVENASFLRLKNVTLQYTLPRQWIKNSGLSNVNLFVIGRNLLTWTKYRGYDPEPDSNLVKFNYPNTRQFVFGVEVSF
jgi:TonB-linked SusC/RagA family outer membrane protein